MSPPPIPDLKDLFNSSPVLKQFPSGKVGEVLSGFLNIVFTLAIFLAFFWLIWGGYQYILASGKKEDLAKARARITWAFVGLAVTLMAYFIARFASEIFPPTKGGLPF